MSILKSLVFPALYSFLVICFTCITFYGGYQNNLNKVTIIGWLLIVPFCVGAILFAKKVSYDDTIGGKEALKEGLKFIMISIIILIIFQIIFFTIDFKEYKINFIATAGYDLAKLQIKNGNLKITDAEIPALVQKEIEQVTLFKECTSIIFKNIFLGSITSVITSVALRAKF